MNWLPFVEFLIERLTSWPVVTFVIVVMFYDVANASLKMLVMNVLENGVQEVMDAIKVRRDSS